MFRSRSLGGMSSVRTDPQSMSSSPIALTSAPSKTMFWALMLPRSSAISPALNILKLGTWNFVDFNLVIFDLSHVNEALRQHKTKEVQGIIGADVLLEGDAIIDYSSKYLYLKKL